MMDSLNFFLRAWIPRVNSVVMVAVTNAPKLKEITTAPLKPIMSKRMATIRPVIIGNVKFRIRIFFPVLRQANKGPIPVNANNIRPMGILI